MRIPLRYPAPVLVVTAAFGGNSPGAWQFGAIHGGIVRRRRFQPATEVIRLPPHECDSACRELVRRHGQAGPIAAATEPIMPAMRA
jgi:hypothetical protein